MHILLVSKNTAEKYISPFYGDVCLQLNASRHMMNKIFEVFCSKKSRVENCARRPFNINFQIIFRQGSDKDSSKWPRRG